MATSILDKVISGHPIDDAPTVTPKLNKSLSNSPAKNSILSKIKTGFESSEELNISCPNKTRIKVQTPLNKENYLSEFVTEEEKAKVRLNLGINSSGGGSDTSHALEQANGTLIESTNLVKVVINNTPFYLKAFVKLTAEVTINYTATTRTIALSCSSQYATIYYTDSKVVGIEGVNWLIYSVPFQVTLNGWYSFYAYTNELGASDITYKLIKDQSSTPRVNISNDDYWNTRTVSITSNSGESIYYKLDEDSWKEYTEPFELKTISGYTKHTLLVKTSRIGYGDSEVITKTIVLGKPRFFAGVSSSLSLILDNVNNIEELVNTMGNVVVRNMEVTINTTALTLNASWFWMAYPDDTTKGGISLIGFKDVNNFLYEEDSSYIEILPIVINNNRYRLIRWGEAQNWEPNEIFTIQTQ